MPTNSNQPTEPVYLTESEAALIYLLRSSQPPTEEGVLEHAALRPHFDSFVRNAFADLSRTIVRIYHAAKLDALTTTTSELERALKNDKQ